MLHLSTGIAAENKIHAATEWGSRSECNAMRCNGMGKLMKKFTIVMVSIFGFAGAAVAADLPVRQPPPPTPVVGKAPIGKGPIGKGPIGKGPIGKGPVVAPGPIVTRG